MPVFPASSSARPRPVLGEVAGTGRRYEALGYLDPLQRRLAPILHNEAARAYPYAGDVYGVFQEMEDKDGHLFVVYAHKCSTRAFRFQLRLCYRGGQRVRRFLTLEAPQFLPLRVGIPS